MPLACIYRLITIRSDLFEISIDDVISAAAAAVITAGSVCGTAHASHTAHVRAGACGTRSTHVLVHLGEQALCFLHHLFLCSLDLCYLILAQFLILGALQQVF